MQILIDSIGSLSICWGRYYAKEKNKTAASGSWA